MAASTLLAVLLTLAVNLPSGQAASNGTVTVSTDAANCALSVSVQVWGLALNVAGAGQPARGPREQTTLLTWLAPNGGPLSSSVTFVTGERVAAGTCAWTFADLPPGGYLALLSGDHGSRGSERFAIDARGGAATVVVTAPLITVAGRVLRGSVPAARTHITIDAYPYPRPTVTVVTDDEGRYEVTLDQPGQHRFTAYGVGVIESELRVGVTTLDITNAARPPAAR